MRVNIVEAVALSALPSQLITPHLVKLFVEECTRGIARASNTRDEHHQRVVDRLAELNAEIDNLAANMLTGVVSPTVTRMLVEREHEKSQLESELVINGRQQSVAVLPRPALMRQFKEKVSGIREALADPRVRGEAADIVRSLIERVTIPVREDGIEAEVEASLSSLIGFAANAKPALPQVGRGGVRWRWLRGQDLTAAELGLRSD